MKAGLMKEKDLKDQSISDFSQFYDDSFFYPYMSDFKGIIMDPGAILCH
jgi:hypothetical protein